MQQKKIVKSAFRINESKNDQKKQKWRKEKGSGPSIFIAKAF